MWHWTGCGHRTRTEEDDPEQVYTTKYMLQCQLIKAKLTIEIRREYKTSSTNQ